MDHMVEACRRFLLLLPGSACRPEDLAQALGRFGLGPQDVELAASKLPLHYDLSYAGIRMLISCYLREFCALFSQGAAKACEVSVPSPLALVMYLQSAAGSAWSFRSGALLMQVVLRSFFLFSRPFAPEMDTGHRCGLGLARRELVLGDRPPQLMLQFGVLCDECLKCCQGEEKAAASLDLNFPKEDSPHLEAYVSSSVDRFLSSAERALGLELRPRDRMRALALYLRLMDVEKRLAALNARLDRRPLDGNSFALAQTVELTVFSEWERVLAALDTLARELELSPPDEGLSRVYCYYAPFLHPWIDRQCRENGVRLMGSAVFLNDSRPKAFTPQALTYAWLKGMNVRKPAVLEAGEILKEMGRCGSTAYLTGLFSFDAWLGPPARLHAQVLNSAGIPTFTLSGDHWLQQPSPRENEVEAMCAVIRGKKPRPGA